MPGIFTNSFSTEQNGFESGEEQLKKRGGLYALTHQSSIIVWSVVLLALQLMFGCADIQLKPKDPELIALGNFADQATIHLFEINPNTYEQYQSLLEKDFAPNILAQLKSKGACCKSAAEIKQKIATMNKNNQRCLIHIQSTGFPGQTTKIGLVPIEVKGSYVQSANNISKAGNFVVVYLVGNGVQTKQPIIASIEIKKF